MGKEAGDGAFLKKEKRGSLIGPEAHQIFNLCTNYLIKFNCNEAQELQIEAFSSLQIVD